MTIVTPAGPAFFCAPAYTMDALEKSMGRDRKCDEASTTSGTLAAPSAAISGQSANSTPPMVSLLHKRSEEHTSELQSLMRISYAVFCLKKKKESIHMMLQ